MEAPRWRFSILKNRNTISDHALEHMQLIPDLQRYVRDGILDPEVKQLFEEAAKDSNTLF